MYSPMETPRIHNDTTMTPPEMQPQGSTHCLNAVHVRPHGTFASVCVQWGLIFVVLFVIEVVAVAVQQ